LSDFVATSSNKPFYQNQGFLKEQPVKTFSALVVLNSPSNIIFACRQAAIAMRMK